MKERFEKLEDIDDLRRKIIGLGERSFHKSYYPELQQKLADLQRFKALLDQSNDAIFLLHVPSGRFAEVNESARKQLGYSSDDLLKLTIHNIIRGPSGMIGRLISGKNRSLMHEVDLYRKDGKSIPFEINAHAVKFGGDDYIVAVARDVTERKKSEEALRGSEMKFRVLTDTSPAAIFLYQGEFIIYANKALSTLTGYTEKELLNMCFWGWAHPEYAELVKKRGLARLKNGAAPTRYEVKYVTKAGKEGWVDFSAGLISINGSPTGVVVAIDITERKRAEIDLEKAKSQAELYVDLMGHDINNFNQIGLGYLELAIDMLNNKGDMKDEVALLKKPVEAFNDSSRLINNVKKLQKEKEGGFKTEIIDLGKVLVDVTTQFSNTGGRDITINYRPVAGCHVLANELLQDVFSNIIDNAVRHSSGALVIDIALTRELKDDGEFFIVIIEDNGHGISDDMKKKVLDRACLANTWRSGIGFGLCLVHMLLEDYHGSFWMEDRVPGDYSKGSKFVVELPSLPGSY
jgi:PAS domain S-box-containing protein